MTRSGPVHLRDGTKHQRRPARLSAAWLDALNLAVVDQFVQVETDRIRVHVKHFGDRSDTHRSRLSLQYAQHITTAPSRLRP